MLILVLRFCFVYLNFVYSFSQWVVCLLARPAFYLLILSLSQCVKDVHWTSYIHWMLLSLLLEREPFLKCNYSCWKLNYMLYAQIIIKGPFKPGVVIWRSHSKIKEAGLFVSKKFCLKLLLWLCLVSVLNYSLNNHTVFKSKYI